MRPLGGTRGRHAGALALVGLLAAACSGSGDDVDVLTIDGAWARPTPATATNGVTYFRITSPVDDVLESVAVPADVAGGAELHETMVEGGTHDMATMSDVGGEMSMVPLEYLVVPADERVVLEPGGVHLMLTDLAAPLETGDTFLVTLQFADAGERQVEVAVQNDAP